MVNIGDEIILNRASGDLEARLRTAGFNVTQVNMSEFMRSGGSTRCLTLRVSDGPTADYDGRIALFA